ncbi:hypothetical protein [Streptomyces sp. NPDC049915]|uniref:hypothetical protein n=1 Tax=Streptomyces sp. NPDC049915 TaxID=3155510 RepID=UPI003428F102
MPSPKFSKGSRLTNEDRREIIRLHGEAKGRNEIIGHDPRTELFKDQLGLDAEGYITVTYRVPTEEDQAEAVPLPLAERRAA